MNLPLFPVTVVGSWPRPRWLLEGIKKRTADLDERMDDATLLPAPIGPNAAPLR